MIRRSILCLACLAAVALAAGQSLTVWTSLEGAALERLRADADTFEDAFAAAVTVERRALSEMRQAALRSEDGDGADVYVDLGHDAVRPLAEAGVLADVRGFTTDDLLADLAPAARRAFTQAGRMVALPWSLEGPALVFDRGAFERVPDTYEAFLDGARAHADEGAFGLLLDARNFYYAYTWLRGHGAYVFGRAEGAWVTADVGLDGEGARRGAEALRALRFQHDLIPEEADYDFMRRRFLQGRAAAFYTGPWILPGARRAGLDVGVARVPPRGDGEPWHGFVSAQGVAVNAFSEHPRQAANLAKWLARHEAQVARAEAEGRVPASFRAVAGLPPTDPLRGFAEALWDADPIPGVSAMGRVWGAMDRALARLMEDPGSDVAAVLEEAASAVRER